MELIALSLRGGVVGVHPSDSFTGIERSLFFVYKSRQGPGGPSETSGRCTGDTEQGGERGGQGPKETRWGASERTFSNFNYALLITAR